MSGKSVGILGSKRGYLLTDEIVVRGVAELLDQAANHSGIRLTPQSLARANRFPHTLRANATGAPHFLVLTKINGIEQAVLVDRPRDGAPRRMTCVPLRFDEELHELGIVFSAVLERGSRTLVLEDALLIGDGHVENATATDRAEVLYDIVHERHRADPVLQPFAVQCARHFAPDFGEARRVFRGYGYPVGSVTLCPDSVGHRDLWARPSRGVDQMPPKPPGNAHAGRKSVTVRAADLPDVYMVMDGPGPLIVRTLADSEAMRYLACANRGKQFTVPAAWDATAGRWVFESDS